VRLPRVLDWLAQNQPDVLCLQELKLEDHRYPRAELEAAGYQSHVFGQKTYNGVAILAREGVHVGDVATGMKGFDDEQKRVIAATVDGIRIVCAYVPNGQSVGSDKYEYKLRWCAAAESYLRDAIGTFKDLAFVGDLNIAPEPRDVHDPAAGKARCCSQADARPSRAGSASASATRSAGSTSRRRRSAGGTTGCSRSRRTWDCASTTSSHRLRSPRACRADRPQRAQGRRPTTRRWSPSSLRVIGLDTTALPSRARPAQCSAPSPASRSCFPSSTRAPRSVILDLAMEGSGRRVPRRRFFRAEPWQ
jgi:hypothetical protein